MNRAVPLAGLMISLSVVAVSHGQTCQYWGEATGGIHPSLGVATFDSTRGVGVFLTNGSSTREWNGIEWVTRHWGLPGGRSGSAMAFDTWRGVSIFVGADRGDTWSWDGTQWVNLTNLGPSPRRGHALAFDSGRGVIVMAGGDDNDPPWTLRETWEWDGSGWALVSVDGPAPRTAAGMCYDTWRGVTLVFGGAVEGGYGNDLWAWDGFEWTFLYEGGPSARRPNTMAFDSDRGVVVLFGGDSANDSTLDDTWEWDGSLWREVAAPGPGERNQHSMFYDSSRHETVLVGGFADGIGDLEDTWLFATADSAWIDDPPDDTTVSVGDDLVLTTAVSGSDPLDIQWYKDGQALVDDDRISGSQSETLTIADAETGDAGGYWISATNICGEVVSDTATVIVTCDADFNGDGIVDTLDVLLFLNAWSSSDSSADYNDDGVVDTRDFLAYLNDWVAGC